MFCHGTETHSAPFAFLLTRANARMNPMLAESMLKLWRGMEHTRVYILTHGMTPEDPESGLEKVLPAIKSKGWVCMSEC